ncbi:MAG: aldehyde dehydrogenase family protein [Betaproteobacteria bacterium]|nr:aldehyde dehydrogenase family protein [Betaproteobacteria bacterium]
MDMTTRHLISDAANAFLAAPKRMLIGADWVDAADGAQLDVRNPATGEVFAQVPAGKAADVDRAVRAARAAFEEGPWPAMSPVQRERLLLALADKVEANAQELAELESLDNGKSVMLARHVDMAMAVDFLRYMAGWATKIEGATHDVSVPFIPQAKFFAWTRREPVGVVGAIIPWNFPLLMAAWKIGPALAAGCTVVLKPAEETPLTALRLGQLILEAGIPPGVVNIVTGLGETAGAALASHPGVAKIAFTGSTAVGKLVQRAAIENMTRVSLELGGKSPVIVLDDADPAQAAVGAAQAIFFNQGQVCTAGSRLYVQKKLFDKVVSELSAIASAMKLGPGLDPASELGPLVSEVQRDRVCSYIDSGVSQGATVASGGGRAGEKGYFVKPTVLVDVRQDMRVVQEEIFGPVVVALPYDDIDEAVRLANDTPYGLGASIWSNDLARVHRMIPRIKAGTVWVNCHSMLDASLPFGGFKQSGIGREMGRAALDMFTETKSVMMAV